MIEIIQQNQTAKAATCKVTSEMKKLFEFEAITNAARMANVPLLPHPT
jgi:hypothetical protein